MDIRQLKTLVAVDDYGGFSAAAEALDTVQSNVSAHISKLESELSVVVVDRRSGKLTDEGRTVATRARRLLLEMEAIFTDLSALKNDVRGRVRLGMIGTTARWLIPPLVAALVERHPHLQLEVTEGTALTLQARIVSGVLDVAVLNRPITSDEVTFTSLFDEELGLLVPPGHPFADREEISIRLLDNLPLLVPPKGTGFRDELDAVAAKNQVTIVPKAEVDGLRLAAALTFDGFGPAILPASAIPAYLYDEWRAVKITDLSPRRVGFVKRQKGLDTAATKACVMVIEEFFRDVSFELPKGVKRIDPKVVPRTKTVPNKE